MVVGANIATIIFMLVCAYSTYINPQSHPTLSCLTLVFPLFLLLNAMFTVVWIIFNARYVLIPLFGFLLCMGSIRNYIPFNWPSRPPQGSIKVLSYNIYGFWLDSLNADKHYISMDYFQKMNPDILCLQEAGGDAQRQLLDSCLLKKLPYRRFDTASKSGTTIACYSRFPILSVERVPYKSNTNASYAYTMKIGPDTVLVVNNHLESNKLEKEDKEVYKDMLKDFDGKEVTSGSRMLFGKIGHAAAIRAMQAKVINEFIRTHKYHSVIMCGDCNDSPNSYTVRTLSKKLRSAFVRSGNGLGLSYHKSDIYVRIDNIFYSDDWKSYNTHVDKSIGISDHYPIFTYLKKRENDGKN